VCSSDLEITAGNAKAAREIMDRHLRPNIDKLADLGRPYPIEEDQH
jgi:DNA-binding GntR family transcriptional regulator